MIKFTSIKQQILQEEGQKVILYLSYVYYLQQQWENSQLKFFFQKLVREGALPIFFLISKSFVLHTYLLYIIFVNLANTILDVYNFSQFDN